MWISRNKTQLNGKTNSQHILWTEDLEQYQNDSLGKSRTEPVTKKIYEPKSIQLLIIS